MNMNVFKDAANVITDAQQHSPSDLSQFVSGLYHGANGIASLLRDGPTQYGMQELDDSAVAMMNAHLTNTDIYDGATLVSDLIN